MTEMILSPADIRAWRADHPTMRERDAATALGIAEAALVAAEAGLTATRIDAHPNRLLERAGELGEVMVLTRNESAVHEKIGVFEKITMSERVSMTLGRNVDLRIFNSVWKHGFAVTREVDGQKRLSLQYFDGAGEAVFKLHLRPGSNVDAYRSIVAGLALDNRSQTFSAEARDAPAEEMPSIDRDILRDNWIRMTDTHEFFGMLRRLKIARRTAIRTVGDDYAWPLSTGAVGDMLRAAVRDGLAIMCFVASRGTVQIHSGPIGAIQPMGPWLNIMDLTFHLHLRQDRIAEVWGVRKPTRDGHVTSLEAFDAEGDMIIQFFGQRKEGAAELQAWRALVEGLPAANVAA